MTNPIGTPDWSKPLPSGSHTVVNDSFNLANGGGQYLSGWFDVTAFNGLYLETNGFANAASFGNLEVQFRDQAGVQPILPKYNAIWRGDLPAKLNVPILGAQAQVVITGPADNVNAQIVVVGLGGGGSSSYRGNARALIQVTGLVVPNNTSSYVFSNAIMEGPGSVLVRSTGIGPYYGNLWMRDAAGSRRLLWSTSQQANGTAAFAQIWIPPQPLELELENDNSVAGNVYACVMLGRG